jgi:beta-lactamase regulating signal transducer with metallopeptidase domain
MLLPMDLLDGLNASQRAALLLHELAHVKRGDHLVRLLELAVGVAYWWLPVVGVIGRHLRDCEEACCDAAVVAHLPDARREYAALLLDVVDFVDPLPRHAVLQATAMSAAKGLEQRLLAILDSAKAPPRRTWPVGVFALGLAFAILPCELNYDLDRRQTPSVPSAERAPTIGVTPPPGDDWNDQATRLACCPS